MISGILRSSSRFACAEAAGFAQEPLVWAHKLGVVNSQTPKNRPAPFITGDSSSIFFAIGQRAKPGPRLRGPPHSGARNKSAAPGFT